MNSHPVPTKGEDIEMGMMRNETETGNTSLNDQDHLIPVQRSLNLKIELGAPSQSHQMPQAPVPAHLPAPAHLSQDNTPAPIRQSGPNFQFYGYANVAPPGVSNWMGFWSSNENHTIHRRIVYSLLAAGCFAVAVVVVIEWASKPVN